jgi:hypothetical protein
MMEPLIWLVGAQLEVDGHRHSFRQVQIAVGDAAPE